MGDLFFTEPSEHKAGVQEFLPCKNDGRNFKFPGPLQHKSIRIVAEQKANFYCGMIFKISKDLLSIGAATGSKNGYSIDQDLQD